MVSNRALPRALKLLATNSLRNLTQDEVMLLGGHNPSPGLQQSIYLVRALTTNPADGNMTVTRCGDTLFLSYVAPPTGDHRGTRRAAVLVNLDDAPPHIVVNAGEGIP
jgi:hypothetical protein